MLNLLNLVYLGAIIAGDINLYSDADYEFPTVRDAVVQISTYREFWREDGSGKCKYTGVMVPFTRDWEEEVPSQDPAEASTVLPADPETVVGHAMVINQKICEGKDPEPILRVGADNRTRGTLFGGPGGGFYKRSRVNVSDVYGMKLGDRPKWYDQVFKRIELVAEHDEGAKSFLQATVETRALLATATVAKSPVELATEAAKTSAAEQSTNTH